LGNVIAFHRDAAGDNQSTKLSMSALPTSLQDVLANWFDLVSDDPGDDAEVLVRLMDHPRISEGQCMVICSAQSNDPKRWRLLHLPAWMSKELNLSPSRTLFEQFIDNPMLEPIMDQMILCQVSGRPTAVKFTGHIGRRRYAYSTVFLPITNDVGKPLVMLVGISLDVVAT
jgi:hypothetical protein